MERRRLEKLAERAQRDQAREEEFKKLLDKKRISYFWREKPWQKWNREEQPDQQVEEQPKSSSSQTPELPVEEEEEKAAAPDMDQVIDIEE